MFTDMVGYTTMGQRNEFLSLALVQEQRKLLRPIFTRHEGREVKTMGDAFLVEFPSALEAVRCAYDIQRAVREFNVSQPEDNRLYLRVGVHLGDVIESEGDISGDAVNVASRIEALAEDGGVCLTQQVYDHVQNKFELPIVSMGKKSLKNVSTSIEVYSIRMPWENARSSQPAAQSLDARRVAVLPFRSMSADQDNDFFAEGMTEELISTISRITGLRVIARTSVMAYKNSPKRISEIGLELNVGTMLEGSVRKADNRIRVTVQLIDANNEEHLWAEDYDRTLAGVFEIQGDIAKKVAQELRVKLLPKEGISIERRSTINSAAYTLYLKGRHYWSERTKEALDKARGYFEKAIELDPNYAPAHSGLADTFSIMGNNNYMPSHVALPKAALYAQKALQIDDMSAEAHASLGFTNQEEFDWKRSEAHYKEALSLNPSYATGHFWYSILLTWTGRHNEAIEQAHLAEDLDPLSPAIMIARGQALAYARRYQEAVDLLERQTMRDPGIRAIHFMLGLAYLFQGDFGRALREAEKAESFSLIKFERVSMLKGIANAGLGKTVEARKILQELETKPAESYVLAALHLALGEKERAIELLEKGFREREAGFGWVGVFPQYDALRTNERFLSLLKAMNLPAELGHHP